MPCNIIKNTPYESRCTILMSETTHMHWSEWLAERVIAEKKEPYVITSGITTSGPAHLGTLCEFLFPDSIRKQLEKRGKKVTFYFLADILDAFDSVPLAMEQYKAQLEPHQSISNLVVKKLRGLRNSTGACPETKP